MENRHKEIKDLFSLLKIPGSPLSDQQIDDLIQRGCCDGDIMYIADKVYMGEEFEEASGYVMFFSNLYGTMYPHQKILEMKKLN